MPPDDAAAEVCRLIANGAPMPPWLPEAVRRAAAYLAEIIEGAAQYPSRKEIAGRLAAVREAVDLLRREAEWPIGTLLETAGQDLGLTWQDWRNVHAALATLDRAAAAAAAQVREGKGGDRHTPGGGGVAERDLCAACVATFWREAHATNAPHTSETVQAACEALWQAAGGQDRGWGASGAGWRPRLQAAKRTDPARLAIIGDMILAARTKVQMISR